MIYPKKVLAVFAHPDDEALGPGGTLALWAKNGAEIHLFCATKGEAGNNHTKRETARVRSRELLKAAKILGVKKVIFLGFKDGELCNKNLQDLEKLITRKIKLFRPDIIITFDLNGISGHLDHIAVASAASQSFIKTKIAKKLLYFCITKKMTDKIDLESNFVFMPEGHKVDEFNEVIDVSEVWDKKVEAMHQHKSQIEDVNFVLNLYDGLPKHEHFIMMNMRWRK